MSLHLGLPLLNLFLMASFLPYIDMGANTLHMHDGTSIEEVVGNDIFFEIVQPEELSYTYRTRPAKNFGTSFKSTLFSGLTSLVPVKPSDGCGWPDNAKDIKGNIALVERGECSFVSKTIKAEKVGAIGVIITDYDPQNDDLYIEMIEDQTERKPNIPAVFLVGRNGYRIKKTLEKLHLKYAVIRIPLNMTFVPYSDMRQPRWVPW